MANEKGEGLAKDVEVGFGEVESGLAWFLGGTGGVDDEIGAF